jgi:hypothetical protein
VSLPTITLELTHAQAAELIEAMSDRCTRLDGTVDDCRRRVPGVPDCSPEVLRAWENCRTAAREVHDSATLKARLNGWEDL